MAQFMGDVAFLLELALFAAGLVLLHVARERSAALLRAAAWLLILGAAGAALCTTYFWLQYQQAGEFQRAAVSLSTWGWLVLGDRTTPAPS